MLSGEKDGSDSVVKKVFEAHPEFKDQARRDKDFDGIRTMKEFIALVRDKQRSIRMTSLTESKILSGNVKKIKEGMIFIKVISSQGTVSISTLIGGISNVKEMLKSLVSNK